MGRPSKGGAKNPKGKKHYRALQVMFNARYEREQQYVEALDYLRALRRDDGERYPDRQLAGEALLLLRAQVDDGYVIPVQDPDADAIDRIAMRLVAALDKRFEDLVENFDFSSHSPSEFKAELRREVSSTLGSVSTENLLGESMTFGDDEE